MGIQVVKKSGILVLKGWDISSTIAFDSLTRRHDIDLESMDQYQRQKLLSRTILDDHLDQLAIWCLHPVTQRPVMNQEMDRLYGSLLIKRVADTSTIEATDMTMNVNKFSHKVAFKTNEELQILRDRVKYLEGQLYLGPTYKPLALQGYPFKEGIG